MRWLIAGLDGERDGMLPLTLVVGSDEPEVVEAIEVAAHRQGIVLERVHIAGQNEGGDD